MLPTKILVICADDSMATSVINSLSQAGFKVMHSHQGSGVIDLIHVERPSLIILDQELPDFNSLAIIRTLRSDEMNDRLPVVLI
jgi:DNA-binding response OmpR family regulator